jgi:hypothetical protein
MGTEEHSYELPQKPKEADMHSLKSILNSAPVELARKTSIKSHSYYTRALRGLGLL